MQFAPAPPRTEPMPHRLVIEYKETPRESHYNHRQRNHLYSAIRKLDQQNAMLRSRISALQQRKELELQHQALGEPKRLTAINLYWNGKIETLEREYDRNLQQIYRLQDMAGR
ncbi:hypothetical protein [Thiolapillus sp.]